MSENVESGVSNDSITTNTLSVGDTLNSGYVSMPSVSSSGGNDSVDSLVSAQLDKLSNSEVAIAKPSIELCVTVNVADGSRNPIAVDNAGTIVTTDKALCELIRDAANRLQPGCNAVIELVDDETRKVYGL